jgi:putative nucleotide binding protein
VKRETTGIVLDYFPHGKSSESLAEPTAQVLGDNYFTLLEVVISKNVSIGDKIVLDKVNPECKIERIKKRINYSELSVTSQNHLKNLIKDIVIKKEKDFVRFINTATAINIRSHSLELLPSIGKKHLNLILEERSKKPFESFDDIKSRIPHLTSVPDIFVEEIIEEIKGNAKYYLFSKPPFQKFEH